MIAQILVPLDGSKLAEAAIPQAIALAQPAHAKINLIQVIPPARGSGEEAAKAEQQAEALPYLQQQAEQIIVAGLPVELAVRSGTPVDEILYQSAWTHTDLLVMATHGRSGLQRLLLGSVAEQVVRKAKCPVLLIHGRPVVQAYHHILVPLDGSPEAEVILPVVAELARVHQAKLLLMTAIPPLLNPDIPSMGLSMPIVDLDEYIDDAFQEAQSYLTTQAEALRQAGLEVETTCKLGSPREVILVEAHAFHAGLIAMASHTRTLIGRTIFGSVTEYVLNHAGCPVLIYRSGHVPASQEQVIDESPAKVTGGQA